MSNKEYIVWKGTWRHRVLEKLEKESIATINSILDHIKRAIDYIEGLLKKRIDEESIEIAKQANKKAKKSNISCFS
ncbi:MAG: hypothetical protein HGN29_13360 [Asgard group archaeon]|nr:hypothetical protein [Asgard group archaeon]